MNYFSSITGLLCLSIFEVFRNYKNIHFGVGWSEVQGWCLWGVCGRRCDGREKG